MRTSWVFRAYLTMVVLSITGLIAQRWTQVEAVWPARVFALAIIGLGLAVCVREWTGPKTSIIAVWIFGLLAEYCGLITGWPFGVYYYTDRWWPTVQLGAAGAFPVVLPFAWLMMVLSGLVIARRWVSKPATQVILAGTVATVCDVPMEWAMATKLQYWRWESVTPPLHAPLINSLGWFLVATIASAMLTWRRPARDDQSTEAIWILPIHFIFTLLVGALTRTN